jgi:hypothetical protein
MQLNKLGSEYKFYKKCEYTVLGIKKREMLFLTKILIMSFFGLGPE